MIYGFGAAMPAGTEAGLRRVVSELQGQLATAKSNRTTSWLPLGVTRETADRTISEMSTGIKNLEKMIPDVLSGKYRLSDWNDYADGLHQNIKHLAGFTAKWSATNVVTRVVEDMIAAAKAGAKEGTSLLKWVVVGLAAYATIQVAGLIPRRKNA